MRTQTSGRSGTGPTLLLTLFLSLAAFAQTGGELHFSIAGDPKTFDPLQVTEENSDTIRSLTNSTLLRMDRKTFELKPELAESWKVSDMGRRIQFKLRSGVRFSDGNPLDAEDVAFTLRQLLDPKAKVPAGDSLRPEKGTTTITVLNPREVALAVPDPVAGLDMLFYEIPILSSRSPLKEKAGLGPFVVSEYKAGNYISLKRNPNYWKKDGQGHALPYLDSVRIDIQQNREIALTRFQRGELQFLSSIDIDSFDRLGVANGAVDAGETFDSEMLWFNQVAAAPIDAYKKAWFRSKEFRRALSEAIQRDDLVKLVYRGRATAAAGPFSPTAKPWANTHLKPHAFDPDGALKLLATVGFKKNGTVLRDGAGNAVEFSVVTNAGNKSRAHMATLIQQDFSRIGIKLNIVTLDMPSLIERISRNFQYEACLLGFSGVALDPNDQLNVWMSSSATHQWNPHQATPETPWEAEIDKLMTEQSSAPDVRKRKALLDRMQEIVWEQVPMIYLVHPHALVAVSPKLGNVAPSVLRPRVFWNIDQLFLQKATLVGQLR